ncbi:MAG: N-acetyltransferase family protein [Halobacteriaceae archaeon]
MARTDPSVDLREYEPDGDRDGLWQCKAAFERELGAAGDGEKAAAYAAKLSEAYRDRYLAWAERCVAREPACVTVAIAEGDVVGYVFVLPETHAMIWDGAVLNEIFVDPAYRGGSVADALLDAALDHARSQALPMDRMVLDVDAENERARSLYERHGFTSWGEMVAREL